MSRHEFETPPTPETPHDIPLSDWLMSFQSLCDNYEETALAALENKKFELHDRNYLLRAKEIESLARTLRVLQEEGVLDVPQEIMDFATEYSEEARLHIENEDLFGVVSLLVPDYQEEEPKPFGALAKRAQELKEESL